MTGDSDRVEGPLRVDHTLTIPAVELDWRFSRSSGPGGQGVNTTDSRVELRWSPLTSRAVAALGDRVRDRLTERLATELHNDWLVVIASEYREQRRNREAARGRLAAIVRAALAPPPPPRRATRRTRGSNERRLGGKKARAQLKATRSRPSAE